MPAVKTSPSKPPNAAVSEPISRITRYTKNSIASAARGQSLASSARTSLLTPEIPSRPDRL